MKKNGVKRGSKAHNQYLADVIASEERREHQHWWRSRQLVLDGVCIALGELVTEDLGRDDVYEIERKFSDRYMETERSIAYTVGAEADEAARNKEKVGSIWCSQEQIDRALREYIAPEDFQPFEVRYDECRVQPLTNKDETILALKRLLDKRDDEIIKLKGQIKLLKVKRNE